MHLINPFYLSSHFPTKNKVLKTEEATIKPERELRKIKNIKIDEDLGLDREDAFKTDDKENRAEGELWCREDNIESDFTLPSHNCSRINVLCSIGLLSTPYAVKGGWLSLLIIFGIIACYTGILLKRCLESSPGLQTYPDIGQAAFGVVGRLMIAVFLYAELYELGTVIILPTVWLRDLSLLSYLSVGGVGASNLVVLCLLWIGSVDQVGFHRGGTFLDLLYILLVRVHKGSNLWLSDIGDSVESQFTLNMPIKFAASKIALWTVVIITISKYALTLTPIALSLEKLVPSTWFRSFGVSILIRTALVNSTLVVVKTVPFFGLKFLKHIALDCSFSDGIGRILACNANCYYLFPCAYYISILRDRLTKLQFHELVASDMTRVKSVLCMFQSLSLAGLPSSKFLHGALFSSVN
ncbi:hypothetical protein REPUB_Repub02eG0263900 [Reevesia pubescens]